VWCSGYAVGWRVGVGKHRINKKYLLNIKKKKKKNFKTYQKVNRRHQTQDGGGVNCASPISPLCHRGAYKRFQHPRRRARALASAASRLCSSSARRSRRARGCAIRREGAAHAARAKNIRVRHAHLRRHCTRNKRWRGKASQ